MEADAPKEALFGVDGEYSGYGTEPGDGVDTPRAFASFASL